MKILIVRHGDPDYTIDSLTEKGWREVEYLSEMLSRLDIKEFYVSPYGRAKHTAACTLNKLKRTAVEKEWLREFGPRIWRPDVADKKEIAWDWLPQDWMEEEDFFHYDRWYLPECMQEGKVKEQYDWVANGLDEILAFNGYRRDGHYYRVEKANNDTIVLFCHFGVQCVMLSHLLGISPMPLWHGTCAAPSSVTTVVTEERREGIASFRMSSFGDISHLYLHGEPPAFAARFCECYANEDERHD